MGLFPSANDFKAGKGVEKDAPRKTGVRRFFELVGRDMNSMFLANLLTCLGFDAVEDACVKSKAWLVMVASDASAKTVQRLNYAVGDLVDVITMPLTQDRLADISRKPVAVYAVTDRNLAKLCFDRLSDCGAIKNEEDMTE